MGNSIVHGVLYLHMLKGNSIVHNLYSDRYICPTNLDKLGFLAEILIIFGAVLKGKLNCVYTQSLIVILWTNISVIKKIDHCVKLFSKIQLSVTDKRNRRIPLTYIW